MSSAMPKRPRWVAKARHWSFWLRPLLCCSGLVVGLLLLGCQSSPVSPTTPPAISPEVPQSADPRAQSLPIGAYLKLDQTNIALEVAQTPQQQAIGLMFRNTLAADRGMLFPVSPPRYVSFWMKNTLIPLDMIFVREGKIVKIRENVPPCTTERCPSYSSNVITDQVIELRAGRAKELGLKIGAPLVVEFATATGPQL
jgi:uncharacterized protein